jgi:CelD/BcsL family acetyltransferase involved in cellulose biosynthesis
VADTFQDRAIEVTVVRDFATLELRKGEWNRLAERAQTNTVFQTYECHASWWKALGGDRRLLILLAEAHGELIGAAPLMASERLFLGRRQRVVEFIGARSFDYCDFVIDRTRPDILPLFLGRLADGKGSFDQLYLRNIPDTSTTVSELRGFFERRGLPTDIRVLHKAPTRLFNDPATDRELPNKKSLKRHYNYFQRLGELEFRNCTSAEEAFGYLDEFFEQHVRRRAVTDTPSLFRDEHMRSFFRELVRTLAPRGWLLFSVVLFNRKPIAMHFGFEYGNRITWYKPAFDMDYAKHSPGEVLMRYLLEYALERKAAELDFTIGDEPFKSRFANHTRLNYAVRVFRRRLEYYVTRLLLDARKRVERWPGLRRLARKVMGRWRDQLWV